MIHPGNKTVFFRTGDLDRLFLGNETALGIAPALESEEISPRTETPRKGWSPRLVVMLLPALAFRV
jgi:hypothetical protein